MVVPMNSCPCGAFPSERCTCSSRDIRRYLGRISRPLLDRIDICVEASPVPYADVRTERENESSTQIRARILKAQEIQKKRFSKSRIFFNSEMSGREIRRFCSLEAEDEAFLQKVFQKMELSARGCNKILKVARTIADLDGAEEIRREHLSEAVGYRTLEEKYWKKEA